MEKTTGKCEWLFPDGYYPTVTKGDVYVSHEAICILNTGDEVAQIEITLFFEDRGKMSGFKATCGAERTNHIRLDKLLSIDNQPVPRGVPYALLVTSTVPVIAQYSRMDTSQSEMALMTLLGY